MISDKHLICTAAVLSGVGGREVPFDVAGADDQGDVVEVDDLGQRQRSRNQIAANHKAAL